MASCENCKQTVPAAQVMVGKKGSEDILIGPCCAPQAASVPAINYHFEVSSTNGVVATVEYGGLTLQYRKSPQDVVQVYRNFVGKPAEQEQMFN